MFAFLPYPPDEGIGIERKGVGLGSHLTAKWGEIVSCSPGTRVQGHSFSGSAGAWPPALPGSGGVSMGHLHNPLQS